MKAILALAFKDLRLLLRDKAGLFWVIGFPLLMALFFGAIFSGVGGSSASGMKILTVDQDQSEYSKAFIDELNKIDVLKITAMPYDSAFDFVRRGKAVAFVQIKKGFSETQSFFSANKSDSATIEVGIDPVRKAELGYLNGMLNQAYFTLLQKRMMDPAAAQNNLNKSIQTLEKDTTLSDADKQMYGKISTALGKFLSVLPKEVPDDSIKSDSTNSSASKSASNRGAFSGPDIEIVSVAKESSGPKSSYEITFPSAILWALIGCAAAFSISIVTERSRGTFLRLRLAPISRAHILAGKGLACFIASISVSAVLLILGGLVFSVRLDRPIFLLVAIVATALSFVGLMMLLSVLGKTEQSVAGSGMAIMLIMSMTGGGMIPLIAMPGWMLKVSNFSLVKWGIYALEGAIWRGFSFQEMIFPLSILIGFGIISFTVGSLILARSDS